VSRERGRGRGSLGQDVADAIASSIERWQLPSGLIPWYPGGHADPWNHVEAAMALTERGREAAAERAYAWLARTQRKDGAWFNYYVGDQPSDRRLDTNVVAYVAVGVWHHFSRTGNRRFLLEHWPTVERAVAFVLAHQRADGTVTWCREPDGSPGRFALLTGSCSILLSLRAGLAIAAELGQARPDWELAAGRLRFAICFDEARFAPKRRWAMDWYYPVLSGALSLGSANARLAERWAELVIDGEGVRCVADRPWVTAAETAECAIASALVGRVGDAERLLSWAARFAEADGSCWTGLVLPERVHFPGGERTSYTAAAIVLAGATLERVGSDPSGRVELAGLTLPDVPLVAPAGEPSRFDRSGETRPRRPAEIARR
jgi:hypothetical protein